MRLFALSFWLNIKRFIKTPSSVCAVLAVPALVYAFALCLAVARPTVFIHIGVYAEDSKLAAYVAVWTDNYCKGGKIGVDTLVYPRETDLAHAVESRAISAGYVIGDDAIGLKAGSVKVYAADGAMAYKLTNELVTAALLAASAPRITAAELSSIYNMDEEAILTYTEQAVTDYEFDQDIFVRGIYQNADISNQENQGDQIRENSRYSGLVTRRVVYGAAAVLLLFAALTFTPLNAAVAGKKARLAGVFSAGFLAGWLVISASGALALCAFEGFNAGVIAVVCAYSFAVCAVSALFPKNKNGAVYVAAAVFVLLSVTIGGVLVDIGEFFPQIGTFARFMPTALFYDGRVGALFIEGAIALSAAVIIILLKRPTKAAS